MRTKEPQIISEELIQRGIEDTDLLEASKYDGVGITVDLIPRIKSLKLSFLRILELSHLRNLSSLRYLRLDNNLIERIDNISHLTSLEWLDLSFNFISRIENLGGLNNLKDISLYANSISELSGLEVCPSLSIISVGRNRLRDLKDIEFLRRFKNLKCLTMEGNPVCSNSNYLLHIFAYVPHLNYLDFQLFDKKRATTMVETYRSDEISDIKEREAEEAKSLRRQMVASETLKQLRTSFLDATAGFSDELFGNAAYPVTVLSQFSVMREDAIEKLGEALELLTTTIKPRNLERLRLLEEFDDAVTHAEKDNLEESLAIAHSAQPDSGIALMKLANSLKESLLGGLDSLEGRVTDSIKFVADRGSDFFRTSEEVLRSFSSAMLLCATQDLESFAQGTHPLSSTAIPNTAIDTEDLKADAASASDKDNGEKQQGRTAEEEAAIALSNREDMLNAVTTFVERQSILLQNREDAFIAQLSSWKKQYFLETRERISKAYQARVLAIPKAVNADNFN